MGNCSNRTNFMTSDSVVTNPTKSPLAAIALKLVGLVTIISALLDYLILVIPPDFANPQWQLATTTQLVDRGIVPLVGIALILTGFLDLIAVSDALGYRKAWRQICGFGSVLWPVCWG